MPQLRIAIAEDHPDAAQALEMLLGKLGHTVVSCAENGEDLVAHVLAARPEMIITDLVMPRLDGIAAIAAIWRQQPTPAVVVSGHDDPEFVSRAMAEYIPEYLLKPYRAQELERCIEHALRRFAQFQTLRREAADLRQALEDRKAIERAKGLLMRRRSIGEGDAFSLLQKEASRNQVKLAELARQLLRDSKLLDG